MKRICFLSCFFVLAGSFYTAYLYAQEGETLIVRHSAKLDLGDILRSKQNAQNKALVKSLMQASQTSANPSLVQKNAKLLESQLGQSPRSFVLDYQFVEQKLEGDQYYIKLKVDPKWYYLKNKLTDWGFTGFRSKPKVFIAPFAINQAENQKVTASGQYWSSKVTDHFRGMGFMVVSDETMLGSDGIKIQSKIIRSAGREVEFSFLFSNASQQLHQQQSLTLKKTKSESQMAAILSGTLIEQMMPLWFADQGNQRIFEVELQNVREYATQQSFKKLLQSQRGVIQSVKDHSYKAGASVFRVQVLQESLDFGGYLSNLKVNEKNIQVTSKQGRRLTIELQ